MPWLFLQICEHVPPNHANFAEACITSFLAASRNKYRSKDLALLLRGLFVLNYDIRPHAKHILKAWRESWSVINRQGRDNISITTLLARMGVFDWEYIRFIIDEANASTKLRAAATDGELVEGAFEMLRRHSERGYSYSPRQRHQLEWDGSRRSSELRRSLAMVAEVDALAEIFHGGTDASFPQLKPELRRKFAKLFVRDSEETSQSQKRLAVMRTMSESFGQDVIHGLSYPFGTFSDIVCCLRNKGARIETLPFPEDFNEARLAIDVVKPPPISNGTW